jgi:hypothetical protein
MNNKIALTTYVDYVMDEFKIPKEKSNFLKVRKKFQRELDKKGLWENAETKRIGRSQTKLFYEYDLENVRLSMRDYLLKNGTIDKDKYHDYLNSIDIYLENRYIESEEESDEEKEKREQRELENSFKATHREILDLKIDALFKVFYEDIDIEKWDSDRIYVQIIDDIDMQNIETFNCINRLKNPVDSYCKRKKED